LYSPLKRADSRIEKSADVAKIHFPVCNLCAKNPNAIARAPVKIGKV